MNGKDLLLFQPKRNTSGLFQHPNRSENKPQPLAQSNRANIRQFFREKQNKTPKGRMVDFVEVLGNKKSSGRAITLPNEQSTNCNTQPANEQSKQGPRYTSDSSDLQGTPQRQCNRDLSIKSLKKSAALHRVSTEQSPQNSVNMSIRSNKSAKSNAAFEEPQSFRLTGLSLSRFLTEKDFSCSSKKRLPKSDAEMWLQSQLKNFVTTKPETLKMTLRKQIEQRLQQASIDNSRKGPESGQPKSLVLQMAIRQRRAKVTTPLELKPSSKPIYVRPPSRDSTQHNQTASLHTEDISFVSHQPIKILTNFPPSDISHSSDLLQKTIFPQRKLRPTHPKPLIPNF